MPGAQDLLIAPVWNRNCPRQHPCATLLDLLIAPVWNRNQSLQISDRFWKPLLIAPVWNRNFLVRFRQARPKKPFNRTSLESKQINCCYKLIDNLVF